MMDTIVGAQMCADGVYVAVKSPGNGGEWSSGIELMARSYSSHVVKVPSAR
jgi:hypothetical protein